MYSAPSGHDIFFPPPPKSQSLPQPLGKLPDPKLKIRLTNSAHELCSDRNVFYINTKYAELCVLTYVSNRAMQNTSLL